MYWTVVSAQWNALDGYYGDEWATVYYERDASVAEQRELLLAMVHINWLTPAGRLVRLAYPQEPTAGQAESARGD